MASTTLSNISAEDGLISPSKMISMFLTFFLAMLSITVLLFSAVVIRIRNFFFSLKIFISSRSLRKVNAVALGISSRCSRTVSYGRALALLS